MKRHPFPSVLLCAVVLSAATALPVSTQAADFDLRRDYSTNTNPNGVWSYGWKETLGGTFTRLTSRSTAISDNGQPVQILSYAPGTHPVINFNGSTQTVITDSGQGQYPPGTVWFTGGHEGMVANYGVIRFTAPSNAVYELAVSVAAHLDGDRAGDTDFYIVRKSTDVMGWFLPSTRGTNYTGSASLAAGETIDFVIGRGADNILSGSGLKLSAVMTPTTNTPPPPPPPPAAYSDFNVSRDFSTNSNPNGVWSYGWKTNVTGNLSVFTRVRTATDDNGWPYQIREIATGGLPAVYYNAGTNTLTSDGGQGTFPPGTLWFYAGPSPNNFGTIRFTAPSNGNYNISTIARSYLDGPSAGDTDFHVVKNGTELLGALIPGQGQTNFNSVMGLSGGETIDFVVGRGADNVLSGSALKLSAVITPTTNAPPPPANFDVSRDFLNTTNPSGAWSYGWKETLGGPLGSLGAVRTFSSDNGVAIRAWELSIYNLPAVAKVIGNSTAVSDGGRFTAAPGMVYFAPGADSTAQNFGAIRFTAPSNGNYRIETAVNPLFDGTRSRDSDFHVTVNGGEIYGVFLPPNFGTNQFSGVAALSAGDNIDFVIGRGADGLTVDTGLKITATVTPTTSGPTMTNIPPPVAPPGTNPPLVQLNYHLNRDFSTNNNPNGVWSYGWKSSLASNFNLFSYTRTAFDEHDWSFQVREIAFGALPAVYFNNGTNTLSSNGGQATYPPRTLWFYPGSNPNNFGAIRFTAPSNSNYQVGVAVRSYIDGPISGDTDFHIVKNGVEIFGQALPSQGATSYTNVLNLAAGDVLDFLVGRGADDSSYGSGLKIQALITPTSAAPMAAAPGETKAARVTSFTRLENGDLEFGIAGDGATTYIIEASTDLTNWTEIGLVANASTTIRFTDPDGGVYPNRFYRARAAQ
jgi:hypothetical protein